MRIDHYSAKRDKIETVESSKMIIVQSKTVFVTFEQFICYTNLYEYCNFIHYFHNCTAKTEMRKGAFGKGEGPIFEVGVVDPPGGRQHKTSVADPGFPRGRGSNLRIVLIYTLYLLFGIFLLKTA